MLFESQVAFRSEGATLRGIFITADWGKRSPLVVIAHGTSATLQRVAIEYARVFAKAGLAALIFDHRNFGLSDGLPRQEINPWIQCRGYRDAVTFGLDLPSVDA